MENSQVSNLKQLIAKDYWILVEYRYDAKRISVQVLIQNDHLLEKSKTKYI